MVQRTAIVTGGSSGIGHACAELLRQRSLRVVTVDLKPGSDHEADLTDEHAVQQLGQAVGAVDVLVNCAGVVGPQTLLVDTTLVDWTLTFRTNVESTFLMCRAFVPGMVERGWGRVVNVASVAGKEGSTNLSAYSATKAAMISLTKSLALEVATDGVLVNAVTPAAVATPMNATTDPDVLARSLAKIPMGRLGEAHEVAELVAWLCSDQCTFSTGATFDISGGRSRY